MGVKIRTVARAREDPQLENVAQRVIGTKKDQSSVDEGKFCHLLFFPEIEFVTRTSRGFFYL